MSLSASIRSMWRCPPWGWQSDEIRFSADSLSSGRTPSSYIVALNRTTSAKSKKLQKPAQVRRRVAENNGDGLTKVPRSKISRSNFSARVLQLLNETGLEYRVGGTVAVNWYLDMSRETKDMDVFCRAGDFPRILAAAEQAGFKTEVEDERWIAKIKHGKHYCDVVFGSANSAAPIASAWFTERFPATLWGVDVLLLAPTELIWSKCFIQDRYKFDGNDIANLILCQHKHLDWKRLLSYMELHWEVLFSHLLHFRYAYPTERYLVPKWLMNELITRLQLQMTMPLPQLRVCRGRIFSREDYQIAVKRWGFIDLVGDHPKADVRI